MAKNKNADLGVALVDQYPSANDAIGLLRQELAKLKTITDKAYKTDGKVEGFPGTTIQEEKNVETLVKMFSSIRGKANAYSAAQEELQLQSVPVFKMNGHSVDAYKEDIQLRVAVINHAERKAVLENLIKDAENFLTEKDKYASFLQRVAAAAKA